MRYIIGFLIGLGLIIMLFVWIFKGGGGPAPAPNATAKMVDYANTSTVVQLVNEYPVTADQNHHQVVTTIGRDATTLTIESGYQGTIIRSQSYPNNPTAYANFLRALQLSGYTNGNTKADAQLRDERGYCPLGNRYIFEIKDGDHNIQRYWSASCGNIGTFKGQTSVVMSLFRAQVPDYAKVVSSVPGLSL